MLVFGTPHGSPGLVQRLTWKGTVLFGDPKTIPRMTIHWVDLQNSAYVFSCLRVITAKTHKAKSAKGRHRGKVRCNRAQLPRVLSSWNHMDTLHFSNNHLSFFSFILRYWVLNSGPTP
jgi:hypothetical protein